MYRRRLRFAWVVIVTCVGASSCGGSGNDHAGDQTNTPPTAVITVIGDGSSPTTVRASSDVLLSGKESFDPDDPVTVFQWRQTAPDAPRVTMVQRSSNSISFAAPDVAEQTTLTFELTVQSPDGASGSTTKDVVVEPASDSNRFLHYAETASGIRVLAGRSGGTPGDTLAFTVSMTLHVQYPSRNVDPAKQQMLEYVSAPVVRSGTWDDTPALDTANLAGAAVQQPLLVFDIPDVSLDDINGPLLTLPPDDAGRAAILELVDVDATRLAALSRQPVKAWLEFALEAATPGGVMDGQMVILDDRDTPLFVLGTGGVSAAAASPGATEGLVMDPDTGTYQTIGSVYREDLTKAIIDHGGSHVVEDRATAQAYYDTIDPNHTRTTLSDWLSANCMTLSTSFGNADNEAHAIYTNNFDLGFGRDMYVKTLTAADAACGSPGDIASIVFNYPTLEAAAKGADPFLAVAMEYRAPQLGSADLTALGVADPDARFTTFYVFTPNRDTGDMERVTSADFDRRGQKYVPGVCAACHGGQPPLDDPLSTVNGKSLYAAAGNIRSVFLPWDMSALLYSGPVGDAQRDPSLPDPDSDFTSPEEKTLMTTYTRANQETQFRKLNQSVLPSYPTSTDPATPVPIRELVHGWYGSTDFDSNVLPASSFNADFVPAGWAGHEDLYRITLAHHCRACHTQAQPVSDDERERPTFATFNFDNSKVRDAVKSTVFDQARMPAARLTMDRFWAAFSDGSRSAAQTLADALDLGPVENVVPGQPRLVVTGTIGAAQDPFSGGDAVVRDDRGEPVVLSALDSQFTDSYAWSVQGPSGSVPVKGDGSPVISFATPGDYGDVTATVTGTRSNGATSSTTQTITVRNFLPAPVRDTGVVAPGGNSLPIALLNNDVFVCDTSSSPCDSVTPVEALQAAGEYPLTITLQSADASTYGTLDLGGGQTSVVLDAPVPYMATFTSNNVPPDSQANFVYQISDRDGDVASGAIAIDIRQALGVTINDPPSIQWPGNEAPDGTLDVQLPNLTVLVSGGLAPFTFTPSTDQIGMVTFSTGSDDATPAVSYSLSKQNVPDPALGGRIETDCLSEPGKCSPARRAATDTFQVTVADSGADDAQQTVTGTLHVNVTLQKSWSNVLAGLTGLSPSCDGCHSGASPSRNLFLTSSDPETSYESMFCDQGGEGARLNVGQPDADTDNVLVEKLDGTLSHGGGAFSDTTSVLATVKTWLQEGARGPSSVTACN